MDFSEGFQEWRDIEAIRRAAELAHDQRYGAARKVLAREPRATPCSPSSKP